MQLHTDRLILRPYRKEDAESIFKVVSDRKIAETTIMLPHPYPRETVDWWIGFTQENIETGKAYEFGLFDKTSPEEYIGNCGLVTVSKTHNNGELGYFIDPVRWNQGYGTEACAKIIEFGFDVLGLERISAKCMTKNISSKRIMEKAGLKYEGMGRHEVLKWGEYEDIHHFGIIRSEWSLIKED